MVLDEQSSDGVDLDENDSSDSDSEGWEGPTTQGAEPIAGNISRIGSRRIAHTVTQDLPTPFDGARDDAYTVQQRCKSHAKLQANRGIATNIPQCSTCSRHYHQSIKGGLTLAVAQ